MNEPGKELFNLKIELLDKVLELEGLELNRHYGVIRSVTMQDDLFYVVINESGKEVKVHELLVRER